MHVTEEDIHTLRWWLAAAGCQRTERLFDNSTMKLDVSRAIGYTRVSTQEQAESGAGLGAQRSTILSACDRRGWVLTHVLTDDGASGKSLKKRPGLSEAIEQLRSGRADVLVVSKLDRLSRSVIDFLGLVEQAQREGWAIVVLDVDVDMTTPNGELVAGMLALVAQWERRLIGQRTKEALAVKIAQGVAVGRPHSVLPETVEVIAQLRSGGSTYRAIAASLDEAQVPCGQGAARWSAGSVAAVLKRKRPSSSDAFREGYER